MFRRLRARSFSTLDPFRRFGHLEATINPLAPRPARPDALRQDQFSQSDWERGREVYCGAIGAEFEHIDVAAERVWWAQQLETYMPSVSGFQMTTGQRRNVYTLLQQAEQFELFVAKKWPSFKRYSGEGTDSMLPALDALFAAAASRGVSDVVIGQAHRGRLGLLTSILRYPARKLFHKIGGNNDIPDSVQGIDDVSSHIGACTDRRYGSGSDARTLHLTLLPNSSHLEAINPVAVGKTRARRDESGRDAMCLLIHGDAAASGQGVVAETYALSRLEGYSVGGTVHVITNNLLGFTCVGFVCGNLAALCLSPPSLSLTLSLSLSLSICMSCSADASAGRSSTYASDVSKTVGAPVLHVNGESMREVLLACRLAADYRATFGKDVVIDLIGYRRHGHNELDEPSFTSPLLYSRIRARQTFPASYASSLMSAGEISPEQHRALIDRLQTHLETEFKATAAFSPATGSLGVGSSTGGTPGTHVVSDGTAFSGRWKNMRQAAPAEMMHSPATGVAVSELLRVGAASVALPPSFHAHDRLLRSHVHARLQSLGSADGEGSAVDWSTAEALAFGTLLEAGYRVRISGQDAQRGTFSHRHAVFVDQARGTAA
jgi:probable 2-oxoglutarate dehydrogenase E1 component DHKTD1